VLQVKYLPTQYMPSDVLTKGLPVIPHKRQTLVLLGISALNWEQRLVDAEASKAQKKAT
jgi:hypothetical protein